MLEFTEVFTRSPLGDGGLSEPGFYDYKILRKALRLHAFAVKINRRNAETQRNKTQTVGIALRKLCVLISLR